VRLFGIEDDDFSEKIERKLRNQTGVSQKT